VKQELVQKAAQEFIGSANQIEIEQLGNGLINNTYKITDTSQKNKMVLQAINTNIFTKPADIISNYKEIFEYLELQKDAINIPAPIKSKKGTLLFIDEEKNNWRANAFINGSYSPMNAANEDAACTVAKSFAGFTKSLAGLNINKLHVIIPDFHNLAFRYKQFEDAVANAPVKRLLKSTHIIAQLRQRKALVDFYNSTINSPDYPERVMHHDCKISNILFDTATNIVICPVDLDTTMPGKYFSDLGDMIRTMTCSVDENSKAWEDISIRPSFYNSILTGYLEGAGDIFSNEEKKNIHYSGLILTFMQSLRFVADFLNGDIYYKTSYPEQNLNRALNQLILLEKLEEFLQTEFAFIPYR
jgi:aminoglycoside phosphotransferase (APT) family kinase protein